MLQYFSFKKSSLIHVPFKKLGLVAGQCFFSGVQIYVRQQKKSGGTKIHEKKLCGKLSTSFQASNTVDFFLVSVRFTRFNSKQTENTSKETYNMSVCVCETYAAYILTFPLPLFPLHSCLLLSAFSTNFVKRHLFFTLQFAKINN